MVQPTSREVADLLTTICIRSFNRVESLELAVESCLAQTRPANLLIIDDGSQRPTVDLIRKIVNRESRVEAIFLGTNKGPSNATNVAIDNVKTRYIGFLDSDDLLAENYVEEFENALELNPGAAVAYCRFQGGPCWTLEGVDVFREVLRQGYLSAHGTVYGRTEAFQAIPKLPTRSEIRFDFCDDDRLSFELARKFEVVHVPKELYIYRISADERLTSQTDDMFHSFSRFFLDYSKEYKEKALLFTLGSHHAAIYLKFRPTALGPIRYATNCSSIEVFGLGSAAVIAGYLARFSWGVLLRHSVRLGKVLDLFLVRIKRILF